MNLTIEKGNIKDSAEIKHLYTQVADIPDGIIRQKEEVSDQYVQDFTEKALSFGLLLVARYEGEIVGEIHAISPGIHAFRHLLTDLTIVVSPRFQGKGIGKKLFGRFLHLVETEMPHILRVELYTREHNEKNRAFYEQMGFINEGRQDRKILLSNNQFHTPIHMAWFNPGFGH